MNTQDLGARLDALEQRLDRIEATVRQCQQRQHDGADDEQDEQDDVGGDDRW